MAGHVALIGKAARQRRIGERGAFADQSARLIEAAHQQVA